MENLPEDTNEMRALRVLQQESRSNVPRPDAVFLQPKEEPPNNTLKIVAGIVALVVAATFIWIVATPCLTFQMGLVPELGMDALRMSCRTTAQGTCECSTPAKPGCYRNCSASEQTASASCEKKCKSD